jgi:septal ring factor EnvC (AmiA/AmiB activator)
MRRVLLAVMLGGAAAVAVAQSMPEERRALAAARSAASEANSRAAQLEDEARRAGDAADKARARAAATAARIQEAEADISAAQARIRLVEDLRRTQRKRLAALQQPIVRLTAAVQTLARRPPVFALVQPGSISDLVHVRALLASGIPAVRARSEGVRAELARAERLAAERRPRSRRSAPPAIACRASAPRSPSSKR